MSAPSRWRIFRVFLREYRWFIVGALWALAFALGIVGSWIEFVRLGERPSALDSMYSAFQLFFFESNTADSGFNLPWQLEVARFLSPAVAAYTGLVALAAILHDKVVAFRLRFMSDHIVLCGLGEKGYQLLRDLHQQGDRVVVLDSVPGNPFLARARHRGALVIVGDALSKNLLGKASIHRARAVVAMCGDDGTNLEIAVNAHQVIKAKAPRAGKVFCFVHVEDGKLRSLYKQSRGFPAPGEGFEIRFFNIYDMSARALLKDYPPECCSPRVPGVPASIMIVGFGRMGWAVLAHAIRKPREDAGTRMRVIVVDSQAQRRERVFAIHMPRYRELCDVEFIEMEIGDPEFYEARFAFNQDGSPRVNIVYVCQETDTAGLSASLRLAHRLFSWKIPIVVCMREDTGLARLVEEKPGDTGVGIVLNAMGMIQRTCTRSMILGEDHLPVDESDSLWDA